MPTNQRRQRLSLIVLCASLISVCVLFGVRVTYVPAVYYALAVIQFAVIGVAAWKLGVSAIRAASLELRRLAVAGGLLILPFALFSLLPGIGPPGQGQTHEDNQLRYLILLINAMAVAGGLIVLKEALSEAGERFYSTLAFAAIMLATPLYLVWATILVEAHREQIVSPGKLPPWIISLVDLSDVLLFFGGLLTYLATAAFATSLGRAQWLGRRATGALVTASFFASLCLLIRGLEFPDPTGIFKHWYTIPGYVVGIPAVPWIMLCIFGVILLRRAGHDYATPVTNEIPRA